jgi:hypothetical protein
VNDADGRDYERYYNSVARLYYDYSPLINLVSKKIKYISNCEVPHCRFKALKKPPEIKIPDILQLPKVNPDLFKTLLALLSERKLSKKDNEEDAKSQHMGI